MSVVHFQTMQCLAVSLVNTVPSLHSSPDWSNPPQSMIVDSLFNLLTSLIQSRCLPQVFLKVQSAVPAQIVCAKQPDSLEQDTIAPVLKLSHRTSIEDRILQEIVSQDGLVEDVESGADGCASSGIHLSVSSGSISSELVFDCNDYLTYEQLGRAFSHRDPEIVAYAVALLCKYLATLQTSLTRFNVLRLLAAATLVTFKMNFDLHSQLMRHLSDVFDVDTKTLLALERQFCKGIGYDMSVEQRALRWVRNELLE